MKYEFSVNNAKTMKGIAIVLMLMHHLWAFPDRLCGGNLKYVLNIFGDSSISYLGMFGKICVSLFFFLSGYGLYISSKKKKIDILSKIKKLFITYWKVFIIFVPIGFLFFSNQIEYCKSEWVYSKYSKFSWEKILCDFFGVTSNLNNEWWFLRSYVFALLTYPLLTKYFKNKSTLINFFSIMIFSILSTDLLPAIGKIEELGSLNKNYIYYNLFCQAAPFIACFWTGILFAKDDLFTKLKNTIDNNIKLNIFSDLIILLGIIFLRQIGIKSNLDIFYVPVFIIICLDLVNRIKILEKVFYELGKESTNMWLIHSFYCYYFYAFAKIVVWPKWAVLCLIVLIILSYLSSKLLNYFWKNVTKIVNKLKKFINDKISKKNILYLPM